jgi:hypothetical protein
MLTPMPIGGGTTPGMPQLQPPPQPAMPPGGNGRRGIGTCGKFKPPQPPHPPKFMGGTKPEQPPQPLPPPILFLVISATFVFTISSAFVTCSVVPGPMVTLAGIPGCCWSTWIRHPASVVMILMCSPPLPISPPTQKSSTLISFTAMPGPKLLCAIATFCTPIFSLTKRSASFRSSSLAPALVTMAKL